MARETVGKISQDLLKKKPDTDCPIELERSLHKDYEANILECFDRAKKSISHDFFIVVLTKKEPLLENVLRHYFFWRVSCPTPDYDQTVYRYSKKKDKLSFLWVIPSRETCLTFIENKQRIVPTEYGLLEFVLKFEDGTLAKKAKRLNKESDKALLLKESDKDRLLKT